ncbi:MAG TPA: ABC transporter ATP-binding protein [Gaiellaceae bacterium]|jgi:ABC-type dipeptide/oligopeptide/nickel transport system ATPase component
MSVPAESPAEGSSLVVEDLCVDYRIEANGRVQYVAALKHLSITVAPGTALGILGETGSGKSSLALAAMRLLPKTARCTGNIQLGDFDMLAMPTKRLQRVRGREIGLVMQDPLSALNPVRTVGAQIAETARFHDHSLSRRRSHQVAADMLESLGVPRERARSYPHQLSGGMQQRALIAAVMVAGPNFLIADEPTAALDKVTERQIVLLLRSLQRERHLGLLVISHDIGVVSTLCQEVAVIYRGELVEHGATSKVLTDPQHAYTQGLISAARRETDDRGHLVSFVGSAVEA